MLQERHKQTMVWEKSLGEKTVEPPQIWMHLTIMSCGIMLGPNNDHVCGGSSSETCAECGASLCELHAESCDLCNASTCCACFFRHAAKPHSKRSHPTPAEELKRTA